MAFTIPWTSGTYTPVSNGSIAPERSCSDQRDMANEVPEITILPFSYMYDELYEELDCFSLELFILSPGTDYYKRM